MDQTTLTELQAEFPSRKQQLRELYNLYQDDFLLESVYIFGSSSTGKSTILNALFKRLNINHITINLIECYTTRLFFESILNKLADFTIDPLKGQPYARCDNMMDFLRCLEKLSEERELDRVVIIFDKAEQFMNMDMNLLPAFLRLQEMCDLNFSVVLVSHIPFERFYHKTGLTQPAKVFFPQYTKNELLEILSLGYEDVLHSMDKNSLEELKDVDLEFYKSYLNIFLSVFHRCCRDLSELRHMSKINFPKYCRPVIKKECKRDDSMALWRHIAPILKSSLDVLYLRTTPNSSSKETMTKPIFSFTKEKMARSLELPYYSKYLLISAYLASYNSSKEDKRLFMKHHGKKTKTHKDVQSRHKVAEQLSTQLGPKAFDFDRLLAIFYAILDEKVGFNNNLLVQVSSLVELQLLSSVSDNYGLEGRKYKCTVALEFIEEIARMVGFNIRKYLSDFY